MEQETKNSYPPDAVIIDIKPTDFIAGGETRISTLPVLQKDGQYDKFLPDEETQYDYRFDTFGCVSFSCNNDLEIGTNIKVKEGIFSKENIQWLIDKEYVDYRTGKVNFSDRFLAKMSGTGKNGNSLGAVGDSARNNGLVPESVWPWPKEMTKKMSAQEKWDLYYAEIPQEIKDLGKEFAKRFDVSYQWVILGNKTEAEQKEIIKSWLPYGPIQIAAAVCKPWNSTEAEPPIKGCGCGTGHATIVYGYNDGVSLKDFDHYRSFKKLLAWDYCIPYAMQYYIKEKTEEEQAIKPVPPIVNLTYGSAQNAVKQLQEVLQYIKSKNTGLPYMKKGVFGPFGPQTKTALAAFQVDNGIPDSPQGEHYGPKTRARMIEILSKLN